MVALLCYHKNLNLLYPSLWVDQFRQSILKQTYKDVAIFEMNYGGTNEQIFGSSYFESREMPNFIYALNYLLDKVYAAGFNYIANTNVDDIYHPMRLELQVAAIDQGYDLVASNFVRVYETKKEWGKTLNLRFDKLDIKSELAKDHNIIGHPVVMYGRNYLKHNRYDPTEQPIEDMRLWQRTVGDYKFKILPEFLFTHRVHDNAVCRSENK